MIASENCKYTKLNITDKQVLTRINKLLWLPRFLISE